MRNLTKKQKIMIAWFALGVVLSFSIGMIPALAISGLAIFLTNAYSRDDSE